jgi:DNA-directed RNA polymerase specialized sigma24 family protein
MDPTPSLLEGILRRASALRRRYAASGDAPLDTWSLVNRVAADKFGGQVAPEARDRDHVYALWTRALVSVLNDLHRRERRRGEGRALDAVRGGEPVAPAPEDDEALSCLDGALRDLAERDRELGEDKALLVALKYFEGLTWEELATTLGSSVHRVRDEWAVTQAWLRRELRRRGVELE